MMISLTLPVLSLADFLFDSILKSFCFLLRCKVQSDMTVLQGMHTKKLHLRQTVLSTKKKITYGE